MDSGTLADKYLFWIPATAMAFTLLLSGTQSTYHNKQM